MCNGPKTPPTHRPMAFPAMPERFFPVDEDLLKAVTDWAHGRIVNGPDGRNGERSFAALEPLLGGSITADGIGGAEALRRFTDVIAPSTRPFDHPMSLAYVAAAPTPAAVTFDMAVSAAEIFAGNWAGGSGAIHVENQALRWLSDLAGFPASAGGTFVSGGTVGNLSALHAARAKARARDPSVSKWKLAATADAHSSIRAAANVMDVEIIPIGTDDCGRMTADALHAAVAGENVFAVVATAGTTNAGMIDDLQGIAAVCADQNIWMHVDGAYGLAALAAPSVRAKFDGIEQADSFVVDPHKWLFAPYDCCALVYREPQYAAAAHAQFAAYLDMIDRNEWNPSDFAIHLSRRARGLPFWFSLATYGTAKYVAAIEQVLAITRELVAGIEAAKHLRLLMQPDLSVVLFEASGMDLAAMKTWSEVHRRNGNLLCIPTKWRGRDVFRLCLVNPDTKAAQVLAVLETLRRKV